MQRVWLQVVLAAGAGLASLVVCSGAVWVIIRLFVASINFHWIGSSLDPPLFWLGFSAAVLFTWASLSLSPLALGAREGHALKATLLSGLCFCAFVFVFFLSLVTASFLVPLISLMALVGTSAVGSLVAVRQEGQVAVPTIGATLITALAIYCASLFTYWIVTEAFRVELLDAGVDTVGDVDVAIRIYGHSYRVGELPLPFTLGNVDRGLGHVLLS
jgi:hypothetical protein